MSDSSAATQLNRPYDVALSFAGEDRIYVEAVATELRSRGIKVFYDKFEEAALWGKDLYQHLSKVYGKEATFCVIFASRHYAEKLWAKHELRSAQDRAFRENQEYILPARFDDTELPGVLSTVGYIDLSSRTPVDLADLICSKLVAAGASVPSKGPPSSTSSTIPKGNPQELKVHVQTEGSPMRNTEVAVFLRNKTHIGQLTRIEGIAAFTLPRRELVTICCVSPRHPAHIIPDFDPVEDVLINMVPQDGIGSLFCDGRGRLPGMIDGEINPIRDMLNRLYLYASNLGIRGGQLQPVSFALNEWIEIEDRSGRVCDIRIRDVLGAVSIVDQRLRR
jgi:hypothetical protein